MRKPAGCVEIFLQPGEFYWGDAYTRIRTLLGSCVTLTAWHPTLLVGGMTHIMIPARQTATGYAELTLNAKYAEDALEMLVAEMGKQDPQLQHFQLKLFGGGDMFSRVNPAHSSASQASIGSKNIAMTKRWLQDRQLKLHAEHSGGSGHRSVVFDIWNGYVWVKHVNLGD